MDQRKLIREIRKYFEINDNETQHTKICRIQLTWSLKETDSFKCQYYKNISVMIRTQ